MDAAPHTDSLTALGQHGKRNRDKLARIPVKIVPADDSPVLPKPP
jgi:lipoic acid synthetase